MDIHINKSNPPHVFGLKKRGLMFFSFNVISICNSLKVLFDALWWLGNIDTQCLFEKELTIFLL